MRIFLDWFNDPKDIDPVLRAGIAHVWFVTLHPFEDGNGRIARAIADMQLARADNNRERFYSMSVQIRQERNSYYRILEKSQKVSAQHTAAHQARSGIDITEWLEWFLGCLNRSFDTTEKTLAHVLRKASFWESFSGTSINDRQRLMINRLFDGFEGKLTSSKWAKIAKCSQDTALRDILDLVEKGILTKDVAGGRSTSYLLKNRE
jgi:Fic family protein